MIKLNIGAGHAPMEGYVNIDKYDKNCVQMDGCDLQYNDNSVDEIVSYHMIEHISHQDAIKALNNWYSKLKVGGKLVIECPDLLDMAKRLVEGDLHMIICMYGRNRYAGDQHQYGYTRETLCDILKEIGLTIMHIGDGTDSHIDEHPCMRIEAIK